jgi:hypothetical protein
MDMASVVKIVEPRLTPLHVAAKPLFDRLIFDSPRPAADQMS